MRPSLKYQLMCIAPIHVTKRYNIRLRSHFKQQFTIMCKQTSIMSEADLDFYKEDKITLKFVSV